MEVEVKEGLGVQILGGQLWTPLARRRPSKGKGHYTSIDMDFFEIGYDGFIKHPLLWSH